MGKFQFIIEANSYVEFLNMQEEVAQIHCMMDEEMSKEELEGEKKDLEKQLEEVNTKLNEV